MKGYSSTDPASLMFGEGAGMVSDNARAETVWFGGLATGGLSNVTWEYFWYLNSTDVFNSIEVTNFTTSPTSPSARTNLSLGAYQVGGVALLFGGLTDLASQATTNDTWLFNFGLDRWTNISAPGGPPRREEAAFAIDQTDGLALLFGGVAPSYASNGSTGAVLWRDTWEFQFSTDRWTKLSPLVAPSGRYGASMVWDSIHDQFLLVGGCGVACSMDAWSFRPGGTNWTPIAESGTLPTPRAGASFAWDPGAGNAILYGGMSFDSTGATVAHGDTFRFLPSGVWFAISPSASPGPPPLYKPYPLYDAATTWTNFPGCNVMWVVGGSPALRSITFVIHVIEPNNDTPAIQCWQWWQAPPPPEPWPPACSQHSSELVVTVEGASDLSPISGATISTRGKCTPTVGWTGPDGVVTLTLSTPDNLALNVSANSYHGNLTWYNYTYRNTTANTTGILIRHLLVLLVPFPRIDVRVLTGAGGASLAPVPFAAVTLYNSTVLAVTDRNGWGNSSAVSAFNRTAPISASADNYSSSSKMVAIPYSGSVSATLLLTKAGTLIVQVVDLRTGHPIASASGVVTRTDPGLPAPFRFETGLDGSFARQLPSGTYTVSAGAVGYLQNVTGTRAHVEGGHDATIVVRLLPDDGTDASVRLVDASSAAPISGAIVTFGETPSVTTNGAGWGNGTDLGPPGPAKILGSADGYAPNSTLVLFGSHVKLAPITLRLTPVCPGAACPPITRYAGTGVLPLLPAGGTPLAILLGAPALLVVAGALYAFGISKRRERPTAVGGSTGSRPDRPAGP